MLDRRAFIGFAAAALAAATGAEAETRAGMPRPVNTLGSPEGLAIRGYDPVAYFREGGPRPGESEFAVRHGGATWRFASAEHKALFEADPQRYLPAYGGFCAYGTSRGYLVKIEPEAWSIVGGRLFLNYDLGVKDSWLRRTKTYIARADAGWPRLSSADIR
ncbi:YHS domain-containing (seleno)protein [Bosea sp. CS1GBMeth4]|uniref:YHS domain-containing (seleno)protein n=1 Tax=Bosea sp. CS1GBMeth4 TaxID=1892849 RepID=UPI001647BED0|nr:YHS domain-containing (seleno)protein [Bosea sp. CS1GBMeth4]